MPRQAIEVLFSFLIVALIASTAVDYVGGFTLDLSSALSDRIASIPVGK